MFVLKISRYSKIEWGFILHSFLSSFWPLASIWILYLQDRGLSLPEIALVDIAFFATIFICEIPTGIVADKFGRKFSVCSSFLLQAFATIIFAFANNFIFIMVSYAVWGFAITLQSGAEDAWLYDEIKSKGYEDTDAHFKEVYSLFLSVEGLGFGCASIVGGFLATFSFTVPIFATSVMLFLVFIFLLFFPEHRSKSARDESVKTRTASSIKQILKKKTFLLTTFFIIELSIVLALVFWIQSYTKGLGYSLPIIGLIFGISIFFSSLGNVALTLANKLLGRYLNLILILIISSLFIFMAFSLPFIGITLFVGIRLFEGILGPNINTEINKNLESESRATSLSVIGACLTMVLLGIEIASAYIIELQSFSLFFLLSGISFFVICIPIGVAILILNLKKGKENLQHPS